MNLSRLVTPLFDLFLCVVFTGVSLLLYQHFNFLLPHVKFIRSQVMHIKCRNGTYPLSSVARLLVPDDKVEWNIKWDEYSPPHYIAPSAINKPWADPDIEETFCPRWNELVGNVDRRSHTERYQIIDGYPRNPNGRTGLRGRGLLGRWGPNHAADPIVTTWKRDSSGAKVIDSKSGLPVLQLVAIQRRDSGEWAIPGGMIDPGEIVTKTLLREFSEEALNALEMSSEEKAASQKQLEKFFQNGEEIYRGYVDDPRNTDNSWMETVAVNFHDETSETVGRLKLHAGDDAMKVKWMDIDSKSPLYASHSQLLHGVVQKLKAHW